MGLLNKTMQLVLLATLITVSATAAELNPEALYREGNRLYGEDKFEQAADAYSKAAEAGYASPELFYNLGNSYYKTGDYPNAILYYERALKLAPSDADVAYNLKMANLHTIDKIEPLPKVFYEKWVDDFLYGSSMNQRAVTGIALLWLTVVCFAGYLFTSKVAIRKITFFAGSLLLIASLFTMVLTWKQYSYLNSRKEAVVFAESVYIKSSPDLKSANLFMLHSGTKVQVLDELSGWKKVRIANGNEGWVGSSELKGI